MPELDLEKYGLIPVGEEAGKFISKEVLGKKEEKPVDNPEKYGMAPVTPVGAGSPVSSRVSLRDGLTPERAINEQHPMLETPQRVIMESMTVPAQAARILKSKGFEVEQIGSGDFDFALKNPDYNNKWYRFNPSGWSKERFDPYSKKIKSSVDWGEIGLDLAGKLGSLRNMGAQMGGHAVGAGLGGTAGAATGIGAVPGALAGGAIGGTLGAGAESFERTYLLGKMLDSLGAGLNPDLKESFERAKQDASSAAIGEGLAPLTGAAMFPAGKLMQVPRRSILVQSGELPTEMLREKIKPLVTGAKTITEESNQRLTPFLTEFKKRKSILDIQVAKEKNILAEAQLAAKEKIKKLKENLPQTAQVKKQINRESKIAESLSGKEDKISQLLKGIYQAPENISGKSNLMDELYKELGADMLHPAYGIKAEVLRMWPEAQEGLRVSLGLQAANAIGSMSMDVRNKFFTSALKTDPYGLKEGLTLYNQIMSGLLQSPEYKGFVTAAERDSLKKLVSLEANNADIRSLINVMEKVAATKKKSPELVAAGTAFNKAKMKLEEAKLPEYDILEKAKMMKSQAAVTKAKEEAQIFKTPSVFTNWSFLWSTGLLTENVGKALMSFPNKNFLSYARLAPPSAMKPLLEARAALNERGVMASRMVLAAAVHRNPVFRDWLNSMFSGKSKEKEGMKSTTSP